MPSALHWLDLHGLRAVEPEVGAYFYYSGATSLPSAAAVSTTRTLSALFEAGALPGTGQHLHADERNRLDIDILRTLLEEGVVQQGPANSWALTQRAVDNLLPCKLVTKEPFCIMRPQRRAPEAWKDATMYELLYALLQDGWNLEEVPARRRARGLGAYEVGRDKIMYVRQNRSVVQRLYCIALLTAANHQTPVQHLRSEKWYDDLLAGHVGFPAAAERPPPKRRRVQPIFAADELALLELRPAIASVVVRPASRRDANVVLAAPGGERVAIGLGTSQVFCNTCEH